MDLSKSTWRPWLPIPGWMLVMFVLSTDVGSAEHTGAVLEPLMRWLFPAMSWRAFETLHFLVRKTAHLTEYAVLAVLVDHAFLASPSLRNWHAGPPQRAFFAWMFTVLFAATDEFHQTFVASRTASVRDVLIDAAGALFGLLLMHAWMAWWRRQGKGRERPDTR